MHFRNSVESFFVVIDLAGALVKYIHNQSFDEEPLILQKLATYLTFHDFPFPNHLAEAMKGMIYVTHLPCNNYTIVVIFLYYLFVVCYYCFVLSLIYVHCTEYTEKHMS